MDRIVILYTFSCVARFQGRLLVVYLPLGDNKEIISDFFELFQEGEKLENRGSGFFFVRSFTGRTKSREFSFFLFSATKKTILLSKNNLSKIPLAIV